MKFTQSPRSFLPCTTSERLWDWGVETSNGVSADTSTAIDECGSFCAAPLSCFLPRISFWKARTDSSLLMEQRKDS